MRVAKPGCPHQQARFKLHRNDPGTYLNCVWRPLGALLLAGVLVARVEADALPVPRAAPFLLAVFDDAFGAGIEETEASSDRSESSSDAAVNCR